MTAERRSAETVIAAMDMIVFAFELIGGIYRWLELGGDFGNSIEGVVQSVTAWESVP